MDKEDIGQQILVKGDACVIHMEDEEQKIAQNNRKYNCTQQRIYTDIYNKGDTHIYTTIDIQKNNTHLNHRTQHGPGGVCQSQLYFLTDANVNPAGLVQPVQ